MHGSIFVLFSIILSEISLIRVIVLQVDLDPHGKLHVVIELKWTEQEDGPIRPREFRERQGFNRRRGAMRRRVHQVRKPVLLRSVKSSVTHILLRHSVWICTKQEVWYCTICTVVNYSGLSINNKVVEYYTVLYQISYLRFKLVTSIVINYVSAR